jgi:hypothetical protein
MPGEVKGVRPASHRAPTARRFDIRCQISSRGGEDSVPTSTPEFVEVEGEIVGEAHDEARRLLISALASLRSGVSKPSVNQS